MEEKNKTIFSLSLPRVIGLLVHYFVGYMFLYRRIASIWTLSIDPNATMILPSLQWAIYILTVVVTVALAWPSIKHGIQRFKEKASKQIVLIFSMAALLLCVNLVLSISVSLFTQTDGSTNQNIIKEASNAIPLITIISTCLVAPIVEECVFRSGAFAYVRKKSNFWVAAIISSLLFASIHFLDSLMSGNFSDFTYLIVYAGLGMVLAYSHEKSDSIVVPFGVHLANNAISMIAMFL